MAKEKIENKISDKEFEEYIKERVNEEAEKAVKREEKKLIKNKNSKIIKRDIIIVILIFFYVLLGYNLYNTNYFDRFLNKYFNRNNVPVVENTTQSGIESSIEQKKEIDLKKYESLINNYKLYQNSDNLNNYFNEKMSDDVKMELVFNYLSKDEFEKKDSLLTIKKEKVDDIGIKLFNTFNSKSFSYFGTKVYFIEDENVFLLSESKLDNAIPIKSKVTNIDAKDKNLEVNAILYYTKNSKIYNILTNEEVADEDGLTDIQKFENKLTKVKFEFEKNALEEYVLKGIEKELD